MHYIDLPLKLHKRLIERSLWVKDWDAGDLARVRSRERNFTSHIRVPTYMLPWNMPRRPIKPTDQ